MADLTYIERANIENFLGMGGGYVMDFSDRTFGDFIGEAVNININDQKYFENGASKAKRLRQFIRIESNYTFGKLLSAFCDYWLAKVHTGEIDPRNDENLYKECVKIAERLKQESIVEHIDAIQPNVDDRDFRLLAKSIRESIENNEPEAALDRLHTFTFRYFRELCERHEITYDKSDSLNAVYSKYVKFIVDNKHIDSTMSERILKYSINIFESFNDIRNNKSFAHDNPILNFHESVLIFNNISNTIKFIEFVETQMKRQREQDTEPEQTAWDDLPF